MTSNNTTSKGRKRVAQPATPQPLSIGARKRQRAQAVKAEAEVKPEPEVKAEPKAPRPNADRRYEATHPDGEAAIEYTACPQCKARKGTKCVKADGSSTNYVHAKRLYIWDNS